MPERRRPQDIPNQQPISLAVEKSDDTNGGDMGAEVEQVAKVSLGEAQPGQPPAQYAEHQKVENTPTQMVDDEAPDPEPLDRKRDPHGRRRSVGNHGANGEQPEIQIPAQPALENRACSGKKEVDAEPVDNLDKDRL